MVLPLNVRGHICCDSKAALHRIEDSHCEGFGTTWRCRAHCDLEAAIRCCRQRLSLSRLDWHWVGGHASRRKARSEFAWPEVLNDQADVLATQAHALEPESVDGDHWPEQEISVIGLRGRICSRLARELRHCCTAPDMFSCWSARCSWTPEQLRSVDLLAAARVSPKLSETARRNVQKLRCGWLPVNRHVVRFDPDRLPGCSTCSANNLVEETVDHICQCASSAR